MFNETLSTAKTGEYQFVSNGITFFGTYSEEGGRVLNYLTENTPDATRYIEVYNRGVWVNQAYRTITFDGTQTVSKGFYEWFTTNAIMISGGSDD